MKHWRPQGTIVCESEVKARINGIAAIMRTFDFLFGLILVERILKYTDNLNKTLQISSMSAVEAHAIAKSCVNVFEKVRTDSCFDQFWAAIEISLDVSEAMLPRQRKRPRRYEDNGSEGYHPVELKAYYRHIY